MLLSRQFILLYISGGAMAIMLIIGTALILSLFRDVTTASHWNRHTQQVIALHNATRNRSGQAYADLQLNRDPSQARAALIDAIDALREMVQDNPTQFANATDIKTATLFRFNVLDTKSNDGVSVENLNSANSKFADTEMALMIAREADYTSKTWRTLSTLMGLLGLFVVAFGVAVWSVRNSLKVRMEVAEKIRDKYPQRNGLQDLIDQLDGALTKKPHH